MTFTDDDLSQLKLGLSFDRDKTLALIDRLEAAEEIASYFSNHPDSAHWWPYAQNVIQSWRKACGK